MLIKMQLELKKQKMHPERIFHLHGQQITVIWNHLKRKLVNFCETAKNAKFLNQTATNND